MQQPYFQQCSKLIFSSAATLFSAVQQAYFQQCRQQILQFFSQRWSRFLGFCQSSCIDQILPLYQPVLHQILQLFSQNVVSFEIVSLRLISPFCAHWTGCSSKGALCAVNALVQPVSTYSSVPVLLVFPGACKCLGLGPSGICWAV